jgi:NAD(P)H-nitrite reductase large subunit
MCPGATWCKRGQQVTYDIGMEMDKKYHRLQVPWKFKMAVSGCVNDCTEVCIRDLGLIGTSKGWNIMIGGNGGSRPRFSARLLENIPTEGEALAAVEKAVAWIKSLERKCRIGKVVEEMGIDAIREEIFGK